MSKRPSSQPVDPHEQSDMREFVTPHIASLMRATLAMGLPVHLEEPTFPMVMRNVRYGPLRTPRMLPPAGAVMMMRFWGWIVQKR
ncbi:hypothetical protein CI1B_74940 [Bradyrhizobium ivorense]|uniref:Uncharacterized protein n=1 Tax=Bradyrhizobium ivorense TaxID=2511166 RepID=A0A508TWM6_9BRAD|nr:hypothetical protein CI1B_74940 [Bradyrhizobium ivorense]